MTFRYDYERRGRGVVCKLKSGVRLWLHPRLLVRGYMGIRALQHIAPPPETAFDEIQQWAFAVADGWVLDFEAPDHALAALTEYLREANHIQDIAGRWKLFTEHPALEKTDYDNLLAAYAMTRESEQ